MTDIDLKWLLPFVLPFASIGTIRAFVWIAGFGWGQTEGCEPLAIAAFVFGVEVGVIAVIDLYAHSKRLTLRGIK